jgi:hypothetical protein
MESRSLFLAMSKQKLARDMRVGWKFYADSLGK